MAFRHADKVAPASKKPSWIGLVGQVLEVPSRMHRTDPTLSPENPSDHATPPRVEVAGQELTLFEESPSLIAAMVDDIRAARSRVWMESYIFADDAAGRAVAAALADRAAAGLDVRLMVDAWGSFGTPAALFNRLRAAGVQVHLFPCPRPGPVDDRTFLAVLNQRNHRKLLVVDDSIAYFGGMNVVDQSGIRSKADARRRHLPASAGWRDVHVRLVGSRQAEIAASCERLWNRVHHRPRSPSPTGRCRIFASSRASRCFFRFAADVQEPPPAAYPGAADAPGPPRDHAVDGLFHSDGPRAARAAQSPQRGVRVRVIVPGQSDVKLVQWACRHFYEYLLKRGIRIYERKDRMLHSKVMVIDGQWSVIGSCNLDARSLRLNLEFFAVIHSPQLAQALDEICQEDMRDSVRVTAASLPRAVRAGSGCWIARPGRCASGCDWPAGGQSATTSNAPRHFLGNSPQRSGRIVDEGPLRGRRSQQAVVVGPHDLVAPRRRYLRHVGHPGSHDDRLVRVGRLQVLDLVRSHDPARAQLLVALRRPALRGRVRQRRGLHPRQIGQIVDVPQAIDLRRRNSQQVLVNRGHGFRTGPISLGQGAAGQQARGFALNR